jgi:hypothetical protein
MYATKKELPTPNSSSPLLVSPSTVAQCQKKKGKLLHEAIVLD